MNRIISETENRLLNLISIVIEPLKLSLVEDMNESLRTNEKRDEFLSSIKQEFGIQLTPKSFQVNGI